MFSKVIVGLFVVIGSVSAQASELKFNGFGSAYYGEAFNKNVLNTGFTNTHPEIAQFSLFGLGLNAKIDDQWSAAAQVVAMGDSTAYSPYSLSAEYAYVNFAPMEGLVIRGGRQRYPIFTASEFINNRLSLPYRAVPQNVYDVIPFSQFDGLSATESVDTGIGKISAGVFAGKSVLDLSLPSSVSYTTADLYGAKISLDGEGWRVRLQASSFQQSYSIPAASIAYQSHEQIYSLGYRYDKHNIVSWGEYVHSGSSDGTQVPPTPAAPAAGGVPATQAFPGGTFTGKSDVGYILAGYRLGRFMPRYTFSRATGNIGVQAGATTDHDIGLNYQFSEMVTAKLDYSMEVVSSPGSGFSNYSPTQAVPPVGTTGTAVFAGVDFVF